MSWRNARSSPVFTRPIRSAVTAPSFHHPLLAVRAASTSTDPGTGGNRARRPVSRLSGISTRSGRRADAEPATGRRETMAEFGPADLAGGRRLGWVLGLTSTAYFMVAL